MFRRLKSLPSLERRFVYLLFATVIAFFIYLIYGLTNDASGSSHDVIRVKQQLLNHLLRPTNPSRTLSDISPEMPLNKPQKDENLKRASQLPKRITFSSKFQQFGHPSVHSQKFTGPENDHQKRIVDAFLHAWKAYKKYAWGHDELRPMSKSFQEWISMGLTIVDSLDTLFIMGLRQEFEVARRWVAESLHYDHSGEVQLFEVTIRVLGGLLSAFHLSGEKVFREKAEELGNKFMPCFRGGTKIPCNRINLRRGEASFIEISTAETGSIQLEFTDLSRCTNDSKFESAVNAISWHLHGLKKMDGLVSHFINPFQGVFHVTAPVSFGASADSYYEYLLKQWIQTGKTKDWLKNDYLEAIEGMKKHLLRHSKPSGYAFAGSLTSMSPLASFRNEMEHLTCFLPGTLALGVIHGLDSSHLQLAADLAESCYKMYESMPTGLSPEIATFSTDPSAEREIGTTFNSRYNIHRPETVESLFYMYRATGDQKYRDYAWKIFEAFEKYTRLDEGYAGISNVEAPHNVGFKDKMETFYLAETLKYLYLMFSDNPHLLPLDKYVFNTEAHPLPVFSV